MSDEQIKSNLCYYDEANPNNNLDAFDEQDRPQPRNRCGCENCFYGRDKLAMQLIAAKRERDEAKLEIQKLRYESQRESEHHDKMVGELEKVYAERDEWAAMCGQYKQERDDAKADSEDLKGRYRRAMMDRDSYRFQAEQKFAMRRELEELLGVESGAAGDEQFKKAFNNLKAIIAKLKTYEEGEK